MVNSISFKLLPKVHQMSSPPPLFSPTYIFMIFLYVTHENIHKIRILFCGLVHRSSSTRRGFKKPRAAARPSGLNGCPSRFLNPLWAWGAVLYFIPRKIKSTREIQVYLFFSYFHEVKKSSRTLFHSKSKISRILSNIFPR